MADLILSPIIDNIIGSLGSLSVQEIATLWDVERDLEALQTTISLIKAVLLDAENKQIHNHGIRIWLKSLGDAVEDADELMDELNTEALRRKVMEINQVSKQVFIFFSASNQIAFRHEIGMRIRGINEKLDKACKDKNFISLEMRSFDDEDGRVFRSRETHSFVIQEEVVGRDEDKERIVNFLLESRVEEKVPVISVVGMGGLGKTTLAQCVFNDEIVQNHFELKVWVCVSDNFDLKVIIQKITKSNEVELEQLQQEVRRMLGGKRYLIVLDDVWEESREKWLELEMLLRGGVEGSRVLVTTRSLKVSKATSLVEPYQLGVLDEEKSWSLFKKMAFGQEQEEMNPNLVVIGKKIVRRCGGIPLAIRALGSTLYGKRLESEWSSFDKEISKFSQGDGIEILPILRLSYDNLSSHLKHCFAYCRLFPKDYCIDVQTLIQLWMAQGFFKLSDSSHDQCLEDVGYEYFVELSQRSFFQEIEIDEYGVAESCKMHDLVHDLAIELAGERYDHINMEPKTYLNKNIRHLSFSCHERKSTKKILTSCLQARKIRTILALDEGNERRGELDKTTFESIILNCKQIRTFGLYPICVTLVPSSISKLKFVRYIDLSDIAGIKTLPKSITNLLNLQTLKLNNCNNLQELHRDIKKLVNLRHLEMNDCEELIDMPVGIGQLTNLVTLTKYVLPSSSSDASRESGELKELMALNNLRGSLEISNLRHGKDATKESESANLKAKQHLQSLELKWDSNDDGTKDGNSIIGYEMSLDGLHPHPNLKNLNLWGYGGAKVSSWLQSVTNLVGLSLSKCKNLKHLDPMGQFPNLKELELDDLPSIEYITKSYSHDEPVCSTMDFLTSLQELRLCDLPNLKGWWGDNLVRKEKNHDKPLPHFLRLSELIIENCPNLDYMPLFPHLKELYLCNASLEPFQQTMLETLDSCSPLSKLKRLTLFKIEVLECLPNWFKNLTSLFELSINDCPRMKDLCPGVLCLSSLKSLDISKCEQFVDTMNDANLWKSLNGRVQSLRLGDFPNLESLPDGIRHLTSLQHLLIYSWDGLTTIPKWISGLISLKKLQLYVCLNLESLPEEIRSLKSLESLTINHCPKLLKTCQSEIGENWDKIAHIPHLSLIPDPNYRDNGSGTRVVQKKWKFLNNCLQ